MFSPSLYYRGNTVSFALVLTIFCFSLTARQARGGFLYQPTAFSQARRVMTSSFLQGMSSVNSILESPSSERNKAPIWEVLKSKAFQSNADSTGTLHVLEIAAGSGVHTVYFAKKLSAAGVNFQWIPTDPDEPSRLSTQARLQLEPGLLSVVSSPLQLTLDSNGICEAESLKFQPNSFDVMMAMNMIHIAPWSATEGLMRVAGAALRSNGVLFLYGPFKMGGSCVESNL